MEFSRQEYWVTISYSGGSSQPRIEPASPGSLALAGRYVTTALPGKPTKSQSVLNFCDCVSFFFLFLILFFLFFWQFLYSCESGSVGCSVASDSFQPPQTSVHGILQARILSRQPFPSQGIFLTQGLNPGLLHCRQILYCLSHQGILVLKALMEELILHRLVQFSHSVMSDYQ